MKLLKNRGDIYVSKTNLKRSREERILFVLLILIILFTVVFVAVLSRHYHSAAEFFAKGEVTVSQNEVFEEENLPKISGKTNFLLLETDDNKTTIHYLFLIQADADTTAYKVAALSPDMMIDKDSLFSIYAQGGGAALQTRLTEYFGFEIDAYADFDVSSFTEFTNKMGTIIYPSAEEIRFTGGKGDDKYTIHINEGEQQIKGKEIANLLRYFSTETKQYENADNLLLHSLTQLFNAENYDDSEALFRLFIKSASSDITVRDFENNRDKLYVFCQKNENVTVYAVKAVYEEQVLTPASVKNIKGYFNK